MANTSRIRLIELLAVPGLATAAVSSALALFVGHRTRWERCFADQATSSATSATRTPAINDTGRFG